MLKSGNVLVWGDENYVICIGFGDDVWEVLCHEHEEGVEKDVEEEWREWAALGNSTGCFKG
jgi:hypothetical protein